MNKQGVKNHRSTLFLHRVVPAVFTIIAPLPAPAQWPGWGGPNRNFQADAKGLASSWPESGPKRLWSRELGDGYSAIIVDDGTLYTMHRRGDDEVVVALDAATGSTKWEYAYLAPFVGEMNMEFGPGPHSTPLVVGSRLFTVGITGKFLCLDKKSGKVLWAHELIAEYNTSHLGRGYGASPLAYKDTVILPIGGGEGLGVMAFHQEDGRVVWSKQNFELSYASPILIRFAGKDQLVVFMGKEIAGLHPGNGDLLWSHPHETMYDAHISTPVWSGGNVIFCSSAYTGGSRALKLVEKDGKTEVEELWFSRKLRIHHGDAVILGDYVYGSGGDFGPAMFMGVNLKTGEVAWREREFAKANCVFGDGKLIILDEDGNLALTTVTPDALTVHSRCQLVERNAWTVPTLVGKKLYVRDRKNIMALDLG